MTTRQDDHRRDPGHCQACGGVVRTDDRSRCRFARGRPRSLAVLLLALGLLLPATLVAASDRQATPGSDRDAPPEGVTIDRLIETTMSLTDMGGPADTLALTRVTLSPGAQAAATNGAHLFVVEAGALTVQEYAYFPPTEEYIPLIPFGPVGSPVTYQAGEQFRLTGTGPVPPEVTNAGTEPAVALVVSVVGSGGYGLDVLLTGWSAVEPLAVEDDGLDWLLTGAINVPSEHLSVALDRVHYEDGAGRGPEGDLVDEAMIDLGEVVAEPGARLLAVESGALNYLVGDPALHQRPGEPPTQTSASSRISQVPGEQVLVLAPGRMLTRNVGRGPSEVLILTVGHFAMYTVQA